MKKIKIGTIGNSLVGKTTICRNYLGEKFSTEDLMTVGLDKFIKELEILIGEKTIKTNLLIYDTAGHEKYESIVFNFIKKCDGILLVYAVNSEESFNDISKWINKIREFQHNKDFPIVLIGNKIDLENERVINKEQGEKRLKNMNLLLMKLMLKLEKMLKKLFKI